MINTTSLPLSVRAIYLAWAYFFLRSWRSKRILKGIYYLSAAFIVNLISIMNEIFVYLDGSRNVLDDFFFHFLLLLRFAANPQFFVGCFDLN